MQSTAFVEWCFVEQFMFHYYYDLGCPNFDIG